MPFYQVEHSTPLERSQRDELAKAITHIHTRKFVTPSLFVNVRFTSTSADHNYIAGNERAINRIVAYVRSGGTRTKEDFDDLAEQVQSAWNQIVNPAPNASKDRELNRVFVMGAITTGMENGFLLPKGGNDVAWLEENFSRFQERARQGDEDFVRLVEEIQSRDDLATRLKVLKE